jgi:hypothetical protein
MHLMRFSRLAKIAETFDAKSLIFFSHRPDVVAVLLWVPAVVCLIIFNFEWWESIPTYPGRMRRNKTTENEEKRNSDWLSAKVYHVCRSFYSVACAQIDWLPEDLTVYDVQGLDPVGPTPGHVLS